MPDDIEDKIAAAHRDSFTATVDGGIVGVDKTSRIKSVHMHYEPVVPAERDACCSPSPSSLS